MSGFMNDNEPPRSYCSTVRPRDEEAPGADVIGMEVQAPLDEERLGLALQTLQDGLSVMVFAPSQQEAGDAAWGNRQGLGGHAVGGSFMSRNDRGPGRRRHSRVASVGLELRHRRTTAAEGRPGDVQAARRVGYLHVRPRPELAGSGRLPSCLRLSQGRSPDRVLLRGARRRAGLVVSASPGAWSDDHRPDGGRAAQVGRHPRSPRVGPRRRTRCSRAARHTASENARDRVGPSRRPCRSPVLSRGTSSGRHRLHRARGASRSQYAAATPTCWRNARRPFSRASRYGPVH